MPININSVEAKDVSHYKMLTQKEEVFLHKIDRPRGKSIGIDEKPPVFCLRTKYDCVY